ncbi:MAG: hypothetical protein ACE5KV_07150 [Thermoplasmata archaeon]
MEEDIPSLVGSCVRGMEDYFAKKPYAFYGESSMHCHLYHLLMTEGLNHLVQTSAGFMVHSVQKEYPPISSQDRSRRGRFDLVVFDPSKIREINNWKHRSGDLPLAPTVAFELGFEKFRSKAESLELELSKLTDPMNMVGIGVALYFYRFVSDHRPRFEDTKGILSKIAERYEEAVVRITAVEVDDKKGLPVLERIDLRYGRHLP